MKKIILAILFIILGSFAYSESEIQTIKTYFTDKAGIISQSTAAQLESQLRSLQEKTNGVQFVIYIENEYPKDYSFEEYTLNLAEKNGIGKREGDNGVLLYVAVKDQNFRWETGYGVESVLPASLLGRISRDYIIPNFRNGDYEKGITETVRIVDGILLNSEDTDIVKLTSEQPQANYNFNKYNLILIIAVFIIWIVFSIIASKARNKNKTSHDDDFFLGAAAGLFLGGFGRGRFGGGSGGFGGFSGGGGSFGGGGFSGKW